MKVFTWKHKPTDKISLTVKTAATPEELWLKTTGKIPSPMTSSHGDYIMVPAINLDGKWVEQTEDEKDRLWATVVAASSR